MLKYLPIVSIFVTKYNTKYIKLKMSDLYKHTHHRSVDEKTCFGRRGFRVTPWTKPARFFNLDKNTIQTQIKIR